MFHRDVSDPSSHNACEAARPKEAPKPRGLHNAFEAAPIKAICITPIIITTIGPSWSGHPGIHGIVYRSPNGRPKNNLLLTSFESALSTAPGGSRGSFLNSTMPSPAVSQAAPRAPPRRVDPAIWEPLPGGKNYTLLKDGMFL